MLLSNTYEAFLQMLTSTTTPPSTTTLNHSTTELFPFFSIFPAEIAFVNVSTTAMKQGTPAACEHIVSTYVVPNILHFVAFFLGVYHFRIQENEQLYALMEKVD